MTKEECLDRAAEEFGYLGFWDASNEGSFYLQEIAERAMEYYTLACLEIAAERGKVEKYEEPYKGYGGVQEYETRYKVDKSSITDPKNLI